MFKRSTCCWFVTLPLLALAASFLIAVFSPATVPFSTSIESLPDELQAWHARGKLANINGHNMFYILQDIPFPLGKHVDKEKVCLILVHGFPTSSFDYNRALDDFLIPLLQGVSSVSDVSTVHSRNVPIINPEMQVVDQVLLFDHVGFGFSEKPFENFTYSLLDHADNALALWRHLDIRQAHIVAHDMGDNVLTEILARKHRHMLPHHFSDFFFSSVIFTNGGMQYASIKQTLVQRLLTHPELSPVVGHFWRRDAFPMNYLRSYMFRSLLAPIWSKNQFSMQDETAKNIDMDNMIRLTDFNGGHHLIVKLISHLLETKQFEDGWFSALQHLDIPCMLLWGADDAAYPLSIPRFLARRILPIHVLERKVMPHNGHFLMLEQPSDWTQNVVDFLRGLQDRT